MNRRTQILLHTILLAFLILTLAPFLFALNNSFRTTSEMDHAFFGLPRSLASVPQALRHMLTGRNEAVAVENSDGRVESLAPNAALRLAFRNATKGYRTAWTEVRPYMLNSFVVCALTAFGVLLFGSVTAYVLSRHRFPGRQALFYLIIGTMMFPGVLTLVPLFTLVKSLQLLDTYWAMVLPYVAGGQVFAIFVFKSFFDGIPEELFESARIDGAGHLQIYWHLILPLSKPIFSVVLIMNVLGTWNNFLWPFITNPQGKHHVIASGLYVLATSPHATNLSVVFAAYMIASVPLLVIFVYATQPFIQGITTGALKA